MDRGPRVGDRSETRSEAACGVVKRNNYTPRGCRLPAACILQPREQIGSSLLLLPQAGGPSLTEKVGVRARPVRSGMPRELLMDLQDMAPSGCCGAGSCDSPLPHNVPSDRPPLGSSGQSFWLQINTFQVRFPSLPECLSSSGSATGSTQPRDDK
jgi:hypothetical protein